MSSDKRTNEGVDQVAVYPKMHIFELRDNRLIVLLTSGNLAITQTVINSLKANIEEDKGDSKHLHNVESLFEAAEMVGAELRAAYERENEHLHNHSIDFNASILIAGQIKGERPRLFHIYSAGNFIESCNETTYFQIGETKYGKPIIDRVVQHDSDIMDTVKCVLISFDSTIRSNISVAPPIDLLIYRTDSFHKDCHKRITENDPYYTKIRQGWGEGLKSVFSELPSPDWC